MEKTTILKSLEERALEQNIVQHVPFVRLFIFFSKLLGENPWKVIIPTAFLLTLFFQIAIGKAFDEAILHVFGTI